MTLIAPLLRTAPAMTMRIMQFLQNSITMPISINRIVLIPKGITLLISTPLLPKTTKTTMTSGPFWNLEILTDPTRSCSQNIRTIRRSSTP